MVIRYNLELDGRKRLARAVSQILVVPFHYLGAPTFDFGVGSYTISTTGTLKGPDNRELVAELKLTYWATAVSEEYDEPLKEAAETDVRDIEHDDLTIEMPLDGFTEQAIINLENMIAGKAALIKKAIGAEALPVEKTDIRICFPWFNAGMEPDEINACVHLIHRLCEAAKAKKRVTAKEKSFENEKFSFRVFLISLGFIGEAYKTDRRILLRNLSGNSAFRFGRPPIRSAEEMDTQPSHSMLKCV